MVDIHFDGAHPDVMILVAVAAGYVAGPGGDLSSDSWRVSQRTCSSRRLSG